MPDAETFSQKAIGNEISCPCCNHRMPLVTMPRLEDLPIPEDVQTGPSWTPAMVEMADFIGAYATLVIVERFGGRTVFIGPDPKKSPFKDIVEPDIAATLAHIYGHEKVQIPLGKRALFYARVPTVLAQVRSGAMTAADAAYTLRTTRRFVFDLIARAKAERIS